MNGKIIAQNSCMDFNAMSSKRPSAQHWHAIIFHLLVIFKFMFLNSKSVEWITCSVPEVKLIEGN